MFLAIMLSNVLFILKEAWLEKGRILLLNDEKYKVWKVGRKTAFFWQIHKYWFIEWEKEAN